MRIGRKWYPGFLTVRSCYLAPSHRGGPVLMRRPISICALLSHYRTSAHLYSAAAASHLTAQALSGAGYCRVGTAGSQALLLFSKDWCVVLTVPC